MGFSRVVDAKYRALSGVDPIHDEDVTNVTSIEMPPGADVVSLQVTVEGAAVRWLIGHEPTTSTGKLLTYDMGERYFSLAEGETLNVIDVNTGAVIDGQFLVAVK